MWLSFCCVSVVYFEKICNLGFLMAKSNSYVWTDIDFSANGKQIGHIFAPHQTNASAYGNICIPIAQIRNGESPALLLTAGIHGDEYEGQVVLRNLVNSLSAANIKGRLVIIPSANLPAVLSGVRLSPLDNMNLHGAFPGAHDGSITSTIAFFIEHEIMPEMNYLIDVHSGGASLDYLPFAAARLSGIPALDIKAIDLLETFAAPRSLIWHARNNRMISGAAARNNVVAIAGEFGGAGTVDLGGLEIVKDGILKVMHAIGMIEEQAQTPSMPTTFIEVANRDYYVYSKGEGIFEPFHKLGTNLEKDAPIGQLHPASDICPPVVHYIKQPGMLICKRHPGKALHGDCLGHIATPIRDVGAFKRGLLEKAQAGLP